MGRPIACQGDQILCITCKKRPFYGRIKKSGAARTFSGGRQVVLSGDVGICKFPTAIKASQIRMYVEGRPVCRLGDLNTCTGPITGPGDPTVIVGD